MVNTSFDISGWGTVQQLQRCLDEISKPPGNEAIDSYRLCLMRVDITFPALFKLVQVLNQLACKWDHIGLYTCKFAREGTEANVNIDDEGFCTQENIRIFASALACQTKSIHLSRSPEIFDCLFNTRRIDLEKLSLGAKSFSALECARIVALVQRCVSLKELTFVETDSFEEPNLLGEGLANAFHLQSVVFERFSFSMQPPSDEILSSNGNGIVGYLLSPPSRLRELTLHSMGLEDRHFMAIVEMLPTSRLQYLNVSKNSINRQGILAFAHQLPKITCLREVVLEGNGLRPPGHISVHRWREECLAALVKGMHDNFSMERLSPSECLKSRKLEYFAHVNWVRARLLTLPHSFPKGLWPLILERVGKHKWKPHWARDRKFLKYMASTIYFCLSNSPILSFVRP